MSVRDSFYSGKTITTRETRKIKEKGFQFPVMLYILIKPGLKLEKLVEFGYNGSYNFFLGRSFNKSIISWVTTSKNVSGKKDL